MAMGMTYDQYWYGDVRMTRAYYEAYKLRQRNADETAWLHGLYVLRALEATVGNLFQERGATPNEYPKEPYGVEEARKELIDPEEKENQEALWAEAYMMSMVQAGANWGKKGG